MHKMTVPLKRYAQFSGRASRGEYWSSGLMLVVWLALALPLIAVTIRRLHDTDRSGWWLLLMLVPFAGLAVLVFMLLPSTPGDNRFGKPVPHV